MDAGHSGAGRRMNDELAPTFYSSLTGKLFLIESFDTDLLFMRELHLRIRSKLDIPPNF